MKKKVVKALIGTLLIVSLLTNIILYYQNKGIKENYTAEQWMLVDGISTTPAEELLEATVNNPTPNNLEALYFELNNLDFVLLYLISTNKKHIKQAHYNGFIHRNSSYAAPSFLLNLALRNTVSDDDLLKLKRVKVIWEKFMEDQMDGRRILRPEEVSSLMSSYLELINKMDEIDKDWERKNLK